MNVCLIWAYLMPIWISVELMQSIMYPLESPGKRIVFYNVVTLILVVSFFIYSSLESGADISKLFDTTESYAEL